ncbi:PEBP-like protein [Canariomyces notabilis]|uniref:PEBP-like protein n=1 Tax=Canariomyces notabilis TaxID=2074819 RepID=A0AAN6YUQ2_9PEZI|nr:PEBP-like protein [Canariomyces arenarius]
MTAAPSISSLLLLLVALVPLALGHPREPNYEQHVLTEDFVESGVFTEGASEVRDELKKAEIIPTVIDDFKPSLSIHIRWPSGKHASLGNTLNPKRLQDPPVILLHDISKASPESGACTTDKGRSSITYVVTLTDPDAPSRDDPKWSEFCHWILSATLKPIPSDPSTASSGWCPYGLSKVEEVMPYKPPAPPAKTGSHRYVFLAFVPGNGTTDKLHLSKPEARKHWGYDTEKGETKGVREWADENGLAPVAANFIYAKNKKQ